MSAICGNGAGPAMRRPLRCSLLLLSLVLVLGMPSMSNGLRFGHNPVTIDTESLIVGRPAKLTCNFVKYRSESVRDISWFLGYAGFKTKIFSYSVSTGSKTGSQFPWIQTDEASATESELTVTLISFRDANMTVGCEVEVIRDNGYGKLRHSKKMGESSIMSVDNNSHQLMLVADPALGMTASPNKPVRVQCISEGANPPPQLTLAINDENLANIYTGSLSEEVSPDGRKLELTGRIEAVPPSLFKDGYLTIECMAHFEDFLFAKKEISLKESANKYKTSSNGASSYNSNSNTNSRYVRPGATSNRRMWEENGGSNENGNNNGENSGSSGIRTGRVSSSSNSESMSKLLDMVDPARHVHPGIPYDFFAGYVLIVADRINANADGSGNHVTLLGELPYDVETALHRHYGRVNQLTHEKVRIKMEPVKVLNVLANLGYRVVGQSAIGQEYVWTLEKKNFDVSSGAVSSDGHKHGQQGL